MTKRRAMITGIFGQDAAYLAQYLLQQGYEVVGTHRRSSTRAAWRLSELGIDRDIEFVEMELLENGNILRAIRDSEPDEVYNLAAQSYVGVSFKQPLYTSQVDGMAVTRLLEAIRDLDPKIRFYQASTSEMYGNPASSPQTEETPFHPRSPYGIAKLYAHWMTRNYRESYGLHATSGVLFNHESPLRGRDFVTRKITATLAMIRHGMAERLELGNLAARRDWGHARDFVRAMHLMVRRETPSDYVIATGRNHSVETFVTLAAEVAGFSLAWEGEGLKRHAVDRKTGDTVVSVNPDYFRPADVEHLVGDATRARTELGWQPSTSFEDLVVEMMETDLRRAETGLGLQ